MKTAYLKAFPLLLIILLVTACDNNDETPKLVVPATYSFERNGATTVSYSGQTDRLNQLTEIKNYLKTGDNGALLDAGVLLDMFENTNGNGNGNFSFSSDRQLKDKTFAADVSYYEALFSDAQEASVAGNNGVTATEGVAGLLTRSNGSTILVNSNGHEFTQIIEKGIMGSVFFNQILNTYLSDARTGDNVENTSLEANKNYTLMEHHWDEAFGYFGVPVDFPTNKTGIRYWGSYSNVNDPLLATNALLMNAYLKGRAAIVAKRYTVKNEQRQILYDGFELLTAATAVHYLNSTKSALQAQQLGDAFHSLSEAVGFLRALRLHPYKKITNTQYDQILNTNIGNNFWAVANSDLSGLNEAINTLAAVYSQLAPVKDIL